MGMNKATRMLMLRSADKDRQREGNRQGGEYRRMENGWDDGMENRYRNNTMYPRNEGGQMNYDVEDRFRDRRGREHYDNGRFAPMRNEYNGGEMRRGRNGGMRNGGDRRYEENGMRYNGRERHDNREGEWGEDDEMRGDYWPRPYFPPYGGGNGGMNLIGFDRGPEMGSGYKTDATYEMGNEMEHRHGVKESGHAMEAMKFTPEMAEEWTKYMKNEDGTKGPHWTQEQAKKVMAQRGLVYDPMMFWTILNAMYSDYCGIAKKHGVNTLDFYVDITKAWLDDKDAVEDKAGVYYNCIVKH